MSKISFKNNIKTTLAQDLNASATDIRCYQLITSEVPQERLDAWPTVIGTGANKVSFYLTLEDKETHELEVVLVIGVIQNDVDVMHFNIVRGQDGTTPRTFDKNTTSVEHRLNAGAIDTFKQDVLLSDLVFDDVPESSVTSLLVGNDMGIPGERGFKVHTRIHPSMVSTQSSTNGSVLTVVSGTSTWREAVQSVIARDGSGNIKTSDVTKYPGKGRTASAGSLFPDDTVAFNTSYGHGSGGSGSWGTTIGYNATSGNGSSNTVVGYKAASSNGNCAVVGAEASVTDGGDAVVVGFKAEASGGAGTAVGCLANAQMQCIAVGKMASASADRGSALGFLAKSTHDYSTALGANTATSKARQVSIAGLDPSTHMASTPCLLSGVATPVVDQDAANKDYVDSRIIGSLGTGTDVTVNQKLITDLFTGTIKASDVYQGPYGIQYDNTSDSYVRIGAPGYTAIQSMMKRCVLNANGSVNYYLHKNNSNFKEDGTLANLTGADGEVMVQIPKVYSKVTRVGTITTIMFSLTPEEGYVVDPAFVRGGVEVPYRYFHAYRGIVVSGALRSRSGVTPTRSTTLPAFRTAARAVGTGWGITDWYLLNLVRRLCVVEFNDYIVTKYLGVGNYSGENYGRVTGVSNALGNNSSTSANDANDFMSYRGIEDFYADSWLCIDGVNVQGRQYFVNTSNDPNTFASDTFTGAYVATGVSVPSATNAFIKTCHESLQNGFIPTALGGSATTYFGDALWSAEGNRVMYFGGSAADGASCGTSCVDVHLASSHSYVDLGAALCR